MAEPRKLQQFAFDHVLREVDQNIENGEIAFAQRHLKRLHVEPVAREHAHVISPPRVRAGPAAARIRAVNHIVMDQRGAVNHLHHGAQPDRAFAAIPCRARCEQQKRGPQPLAAAFAQVAGNFGDRLDGAAALRRDLLLDERKIVADQIENAFRNLYGERHGFHFTWAF